ncbi:heterokaryon incompatibility protein-domain-containing protein [Hypomontagnella submonticulosa]|nr:heterokaryon incompatibility protein-domain-containing protein [Hypomontagnella submonticulosa]
MLFISGIPRGSYVILSHTWEDEEVGFREFGGLKCARKKKGFTKIERIVQIARRRNLKYAWVDSCCIDKTSSAGSFEAMILYINGTRYHEQRPGDVPQLWEANFRAPRWLTRGWTLQQLIAPGEVEFYDVDWNPIGAIIELSDLIEDTTKTASRIIKHSQPHMAYCLLGIFGINMPLLYGEGEKASIRLQEEIYKQSTDMSLFAWEAMPPSSSGAPAPKASSDISHLS